MRVLLVNPAWHAFQRLRLTEMPLGTALIAAVLERAGHDVLIYNSDWDADVDTAQGGDVVVDYEYYAAQFRADNPVYGKLVRVAEGCAPDVVGVSLTTANCESGYLSVAAIRAALPHARYIAGGPHATIMPHEVLLRGGFDVAVMGEGEETILELLSGRDLREIAGIAWKRQGDVVVNPGRPPIGNLDEWPFPAYHLAKGHPGETYAVYNLMSSRGCPFPCAFCASNLLWTRRTRYRTPDNILREIVHAHDRYGYSHFRFDDDTFTLRKGRTLDICRRIRDLPFRVSWGCDTHISTLDEETLREMKLAGCRTINIGIESGSPVTLKRIKKRLDLDQLDRVLAWARQLGVSTLGYFMVGFPGETNEDVAMTLNLMNASRLTHICCSIFTPYPGTELFDALVAEGALTLPVASWAGFFHHSPTMRFAHDINDREWKRALARIHHLTKRRALLRRMRTAMRQPYRIPPYLWTRFAGVFRSHR